MYCRYVMVVAKGNQMQLRRHLDIVAIKNGAQAPLAFHARNLEVASISEEAWNSMAPTTFDNGFEMKMLPEEKGVVPSAYEALNEWQLEESAQVTSYQPEFKIKTLTLNVTQLCNLHCSYCAAGGDGTYGDPVARVSIDKTFPQIEFFLNRLSPGDTFQIIFLGGEPLLYPEAIKAIAEHTQQLALSKKIAPSFHVITNATLITKSIVDMLSAISAHVTVSIDGPPEIQDLTRPQKNGVGSAHQTVRGLEMLIARKKELGTILLHAVFSKNNLEPVRVYEYFRGFNVDAYEFTFDVTSSDTTDSAKFINEMTQVMKLAFSRGGEQELRKFKLFDSYFNALDNQSRMENHCGSGKTLLSVDSRNKIYACPLDVGNSKNLVGESQTVDEDKLKDLQMSFIEKNNCQTCWARFICGGGCLFAHKSLTGSKNQKHPSYCERTRYLLAETILYYEQCRG